MAQIEQLKTVEQDSKDVVNGYMKSMQTLLSLEMIPPLIISLIILYYDIKEWFLVSGKNITISDEDNVISSHELTACTAYGNLTINAISGYTFIWKLWI